MPYPTPKFLQQLLSTLSEWKPLKALFNYPTPEIEDTIVSELVDAFNAQYTPLEYGTKYNSVEHTCYTKPLPNHVLVFQAPEGVDGRWIRRTWASNRVDQDSYNYSIEYPDGDPDFPRYTRVYVLPRATYEPLEPLSDDPVDPNAKLVSEQMLNEVEPAELNSLYVKVARVYETLPGALTVSYDYDTELNANVKTSRQVIASFITPLADPPVDNVPVEPELTLELRESPRTKYTKIRIISELLTLPATKTEFQTGRYPFPALVTGITLFKEQLTLDPDRSEIRWYPTMRAEPNVPALFKTITSFHIDGATTETLFVINPRNLIYRGISFQISINNVLNNSITTGAFFTDDANYGNMGESITFSSSTPSATDYTALIGTYQTVGCDITRWRGRIWVKVTQQVLLI